MNNDFSENTCFFAGVDIGSRTCKGVIIDNNGRLIIDIVRKTGLEGNKIALDCFEKMLTRSGLKRKQIKYIVSTGYGRRNVDFADKEITEITCHAKGAIRLFPNIRGLIDIGGQDSKVISLSSDGKVKDFSMNDKCAAGTGKFLETMALTLNISLDELSKLGLQTDESVDISNVCTVFAESEVINHVHSGKPKEAIINGLYQSVANKILKQINGINISSKVAMSGGVAKNKGVVKKIEQNLGFSLEVPSKPQIVGALGAANLAKSYYN